MKKILLISLILISAMTLNMNAENKTVVEGRYWNYLVVGSPGYGSSEKICYISKNYHFKGTIQLDGKEYNIFRDENEKEIAYLREEDNKVFLHLDLEGELQFYLEQIPEEKTEVMIYDFSCKLGDTFSCVGFDDMASHYGCEYEATVEAIGTLTYNDYKYTYQDFYVTDKSFNTEQPYRNIEGLGNVTGLLPFPQFANWSSGSTKISECLYSVTDVEGNIIYKDTQLANKLDGNIPTNLSWQYYVEYGYIHLNEKNNLRLENYSIVPSDELKYPYVWKAEGYSQFEQKDWEDPWHYIGSAQVNEPQAYLREEDGKVYVSLESFKIPEGELYGWYLCERELSYFNPGTQDIEPYTAKPGEEVVLYDYVANVGDRYRTIIFGSIICDVTVTKVTETDEQSTNEYISNGMRVVEVLPDYALSLIGTEGVDLEPYTIKYAQGIGNIFMGNYLYLLTEPYVLPDDGYDASYVINNIYTDDGAVYYKGRNFQDISGVNEISVEKAESIIFDLHGREVANPIPGSIYIRDGKKFVAKD